MSTPTHLAPATTFALGSHLVQRIGYGAMQLAGPGVWGPPKNSDAARALLREVVAQGVNHLDTSDIYGPHVTNHLIREALHPYPDDLLIATKVGARRGPNGSWEPAWSAADIARAVDDNLRHLALDTLDVVYLRVMFDPLRPVEGSIEEPLSALVELQRAGKLRHIGLSNVTAKQVAQGRAVAEIVSVQNHYNLTHRHDDRLIDELAAAGIAYVPFFPLGGFAPLHSEVLSKVATELGATPMQVALAWLLQRSPNLLPIPGTSNPEHLDENLAAAELVLPAEYVTMLERA